MKRLLPALLGFAMAGALLAQAPSDDWRTITTEHFRVHYAAPFEAWAKRMTSSLEGIHAEVTAFVGYSPPRPVDVVVSDPAADANGYALPFLDRPSMVLWAYPPDVESSLGDFGDWMDLLSVHELAHVVHLTRPRNRAGILSRLAPVPLGPITLTAPRWVIEGYATVVEGALTGSGRPNSAFRAMVLRRFAIEGKLPSYGALSGLSGWLGGSMAYLVGSGYLEWLEAKEGEGSLRRLWKRMTSRRGGDFSTAFRAVFGRSPADLYDRFRAEVTARAIEEERRRETAGIVGGKLWQRLSGGTFSPEVSPDGKALVALRAPRRGERYLAAWTLAPTEEERRDEEARSRREEKLREDPEEIVDKPELPRPRSPRWKLHRWNGQAPQEPRWMPDSRRVLFSRRVPDSESVLRLDLFAWDLEAGTTVRVTRLADVSDADPSPDGTWAVAVRNRYGVSGLVRVDLASGEVRAIESGGNAGTAWRVFGHPRLSPDGRSIAALLHERGEWRLVVLPSGGGEPRELARSAVGPPAWSRDGSRIYFASDASGVWELAAVDADGSESPETLTRVTGGAFSPAPDSEGAGLFFLELTAKGVDLRRLALPAEPVLPLPRGPEDFPILPPADVVVRTFATAAIPSPTAYRATATQAIRAASGFTLGPSGNSWQSGVEGRDVIGRVGWQALGAFGNAAGPRGGALSVSWSGFVPTLRVDAFSSLEKPGSQRLFPRSDLDEERRGVFAGADWGRPFDGGRVGGQIGGGWTRIEALQARETFSRTVASSSVEGVLTRTRNRWGFSLGLELAGAVGNTDGGTWTQFLGEARVSGITRFATLSASARYGDTGGSPSRFDVFLIGGAGSSIWPPGLDRNRISSPALPAGLQTGERLETFRADLGLGGAPILLYAEWLRAYDPDAPKPERVRVEGIELRLERLLPSEIRPDSLSFYVGVARVRSASPDLTTTQGYGGLVYRP
jgi:hypothetical protein